MVGSETGSAVNLNGRGSNLSDALRIALFRSMLRIRLVEERIVQLYPEGDMRCPTHLSIGQEAVAAGICASLQRTDYVISAHRSHAHYLAKGGNVSAMFAELYGKESGCASGKGGSMHLIDLDANFLGCVPIVGSTIPIGVGAAFGASLLGDNAVTVIFFGDGAAETGVFHESLNFANVHNLPILFVCENNLYSVNTPLAPRQPATRTIADLAKGHAIESHQADGQEVEGVYGLAANVLDRIRGGNGPVLIELMTYRWAEHCGPNQDLHLGYRSKEEFDAWQARCPIRLHRQLLARDNLLSTSDEKSILDDVNAEIDSAVLFARSSPFPDRAELSRGVYAQ